MKRLLLAAVALYCASVSAQTINPSQIRPSSTNGQVLTTTGGVTTWENGGGGSGGVGAGTTGQLAQYPSNGTNVVGATVSGDATIAVGGAVSVQKINGVAITGTPSAGQAPVATGPTSATWQAVAATFPPSQANTYIVGEGDSRMANSSNTGPNSLPDQNLISQIMLQSNFVNSAGSVDLGVGGSVCSTMTARYATGAHNYRPGGSAVPGNVTKSILILQIGVNDLRASVSAVAEEACMTSYIANAIADGFTVVPMTVYWYSGYTTTQETQAQIYNDWLRQLPASGQFPAASLPFVFDYDLFFPPETSSPYYQAGGSAPIAITSVSVTSTVASFVTAAQTLAANNLVLLTGYSGAAACLNNQYVTVSATGLSTTTFQAPVGCPNLTAGAGTLQLTGYDGLHMGAAGVALAAKNFNAVYTIAQTGTMLTQTNGRSYIKPPSGYMRVDGCFHAGGPGPTNCQSPGTLYSNLVSDTTQGLLILGNGNLFVRGTSGWESTMTSGGHYTITGGTAPFSYTGGAIVSGVTGTTIPSVTSGALMSCTNTACSTGRFAVGSQTIDVNSTNFIFSSDIQLASFSPPTCDATTGGQFNYNHTNSSTKDIVQVCAQDASGTYAWRTIY